VWHSPISFLHYSARSPQRRRAHRGCAEETEKEAASRAPPGVLTETRPLVPRARRRIWRWRARAPISRRGVREDASSPHEPALRPSAAFPRRARDRRRLCGERTQPNSAESCYLTSARSGRCLRTTSRSSSRVSGLVMRSSQPALRQRARSSPTAWAVTATIGTPHPDARAIVAMA
jgi:hypothetical protein